MSATASLCLPSALQYPYSLIPSAKAAAHWPKVSEASVESHSDSSPAADFVTKWEKEGWEGWAGWAVREGQVERECVKYRGRKAHL